VIIPEITTLNNLMLLKDDHYPDRRYIGLASPRIKIDNNNKPQIRLLRWLSPDIDTNPEHNTIGARLSIDIELSPTEQEISNTGINPGHIHPIPWIDASVELSGNGFDSVSTTVAITNLGQATIVTDIPNNTADVLAPLLSADVQFPLQATWKGHVRARLPKITIQASASYNDIKRRMAIVNPSGSSVITRSLLEASATIKISGGSDQSIENSLKEWVLDELYLKLEHQEELVIHASAADVINWPVYTSLTLGENINPEQRPDLVKKIILSRSELNKPLPTNIRVLGDFDDQLERVDIEIIDTDTNKLLQISISSNNDKQIIIGDTNHKWRYRYKLTNRSPAAWSSWSETTTSKNIIIPVSIQQTLMLEILAATIDFDKRWKSIDVKLKRVQENGEIANHRIILDKNNQQSSWRIDTNGETGNLTTELIYYAYNGLVLKKKSIIENENELIIHDPYDSQKVKRVVIPTGNGWKDVSLAMIDIKYRHDELEFSNTVELNNLGDYIEWNAPTNLPEPHSIEWRSHVSFKDGGFITSDWTETSQKLITVFIEGEKLRDIQILPVFFVIDNIQQISITITNGAFSKTLTLTDKNPVTLQIPPGPYSYSCSILLNDQSIINSERERDDDVIIIPRT